MSNDRDIMEIIAGLALVVVAAVLVSVVASDALLGLRVHHTGHPMRASTQMRRIHQGFVLDSQSNNGFFPGMDPHGAVLDATVEGRLKALIDGDYVTPAYLVSPLENQGKTPWVSGPFTSQNFSYALLEIDSGGLRASEWSETTNGEAIMASDRNTGASSADADVMSIHTKEPGVWEGNLVFNDNHAIYVTSHRVTTRYGDTADAPTPPDDDNIFEPAGPDDAFLIQAGK